MSQELISKIEEKLGGLLDFITFENSQKVYEYLSRYIQWSHLSIAVILLIILVIAILITVWISVIDDSALGLMGFICFIIFIIFALKVYQTISAYLFPAMSIVDWLK